MPARSIERVAHARLMPPVVLEIGRLAGLVYRSSKWVGRPRTYIHYMDDPPRLVSDVTGRRLFIVGGSYRVTAQGDRRMNLGLDELMIVNPGSAAIGDHVVPRRRRRPLPDHARSGEDATREAALGDAEPLPSFFLGDDGTLYERT